MNFIFDKKKVDTISNIQLAGLNSNPHGGKGLRDLIYRAIGVLFYPPPGSKHYKLLQLEQFHGTSHINDNHKNNTVTAFTRIV